MNGLGREGETLLWDVPPGVCRAAGVMGRSRRRMWGWRRARAQRRKCQLQVCPREDEWG